MSVRHPDSSEKNLKQISVVAKQTISIGSTLYKPPQQLIVSANFFRKYGCYLNCGACCPNFTKDYLPAEYRGFCEDYPEYADLGKARAIEVNGIRREIVTISADVYQERHSKEWCRFVDLATGACTIHKANPFSCRVELIKFVVVNEIGYLRKAPFGRAWNMTRAIDGVKDVLCDFSDFDEQQFYNNDIPVLRMMLAWANYFEIETHLKEIIETLLLAVEIRRFEPITFYNRLPV